MKLNYYIKLDKGYKKSLEYYYTKNLGIGAVGMFLFCTFVIAGAWGKMDHIVIFNIYVICFMIASSFYFWPLIQVRENLLIISVFKKFRNIPVNKRLFMRSKLILLIRFSVCFYIPVQIMHFIGLLRTDTSYLSIIGFWPLGAMLIVACVQYLYMRFRARDFME